MLVFALYLQSAEISANQPEFSEPGYEITVKTQEIDNTWLFLSKRTPGNWMNLDSAKVETDEPVKFSGKLGSPEVLYLRLENSDKPVSFFAENSTIVILPDFNEPSKTKVSGSSVHDEYKTYQAMFSEINEKREALYSEYMKARSSGENEKMKEITSTFDELAEQEMKTNKDFIRENKGSWVSPYVIRQSMYYSLEVDELKSVVNSLDRKVENSVYVNELKKHISVLEKVAIGQKFTDFELPTPEGSKLALSDLTGNNYLLIDFWASWCGPCRRENPNVVALYNEYKDKGFDILGVSFDSSRENWLKAIDDDNLNWHHVSDLKGWASSAGKLYGVNSIPHTLLLDPEGRIIDKNLHGEELREKLEELLTD